MQHMRTDTHNSARMFMFVYIGGRGPLHPRISRTVLCMSLCC